jgi:2'-5' RNA ligase
MPRVLWAGVDAGAERLCHVARELNPAFAAAGLGLEERAYVPHVTLARLKRRVPLDAAALAKVLPDAATYDFGVSTCDTLVLYSSELTPDGPLYTRVAHWTLGDTD